MHNIAKTSPNTSFTIRCPSELMKGIDEQVEQTRQNKTDVIVGMLLNSIPSVHITERVKLPSLPGLYFVYTLSHQLLYIGKADNLRTRWNSHHKYQYFIESSIDSRIGYFTFDSIDNLNQTIEEFKSEPTETIQTKTLVTSDQFQKLEQELTTLKKQFNDK